MPRGYDIFGGRNSLAQDLFSSDLPEINESVRKNIAGMLERPVPDEAATKDMIFKQCVFNLLMQLSTAQKMGSDTDHAVSAPPRL